MNATDLYPRPKREEIAARVSAAPPGAKPPPRLDDDTVVTRFAVHLRARMRALDWEQAAIQERAGVSAHVAARAVNGTGVDLALAGKLADLVGLDLRTMLGPYKCHTCDGKPPAGFGCLECGTEGARPS